jgi:hypothetical protein
MGETWNARTWQELEQWERELLPAEVVARLTGKEDR